MLAAIDLTCIKRDRVLFENLNLSIGTGELVYLRGPNGAGKTSLLHILTGIGQAQEGRVEFNGKAITQSDCEYFSELIYQGHKSALNSTFNALENLTFWCAQHQVPVTRERLFEVLQDQRLTGLEDVPVRFLSAGQQRRVALSRLWLKPAKLWVLDEPFTALDVQGVAHLEAHIGNHVERGGAVLMTSHQNLSERVGNTRIFDLEYRI